MYTKTTGGNNTRNRRRNNNNDNDDMNSDNEDDLEDGLFAPDGLISQELLTAYISYAKENFTPKINNDAADALVNGYVAMRNLNGNGTITATTRQLESLIRISEALAKMRLSNEVTKDDVEEVCMYLQLLVLLPK